MSKATRADPVAFRLIEIDEFIAELWKLYLVVKAEGYVQVR